MQSKLTLNSVAMDKEVKEAAVVTAAVEDTSRNGANTQLIPKSVIQVQKNTRQRSHTFSTALKAESNKGSVSNMQRGIITAIIY